MRDENSAAVKIFVTVWKDERYVRKTFVMVWKDERYVRKDEKCLRSFFPKELLQSNEFKVRRFPS